MRFKNGSNKVVIELRVVQFWSEITRMISDQIAHSKIKFISTRGYVISSINLLLRLIPVTVHLSEKFNSRKFKHSINITDLDI